MGFCHDEKGFFPEKAKNVCRDDRCREGGGANLTGIRTVNFTILLEITQTKESQTMKSINKQQKLSINGEISANCRYFEVRNYGDCKNRPETGQSNCIRHEVQLF